MAGVNNQKVFIIAIDSRLKSSGAFVGTRYFANRSFTLFELAGGVDTITRVYGIVREINGFGQSMGEVMPDYKYGSVTLDVTRGTLEFDKRTYDLFEQQTILHQKITCYSLEKQEDVNSVLADWQVEFTGQIASIGIDPGSKTMTLNLKANPIPNNIPNYQVTKANFPDVDDNGSGRFLPLIFGVNKVPLYLLKTFNDNAGSTGYIQNLHLAYGTSLYNAVAARSFINGAILNKYCLNGDNFYSPVVFPVGSGYSNLQVLDPGGSQSTGTVQLPFSARKLNKTLDAQSYIITSVYGPWKPAGDSSWINQNLKPSLVIEIIERLPTADLPNAETGKVGTAQAAFILNVANFASINFPATFDKFVFLYRNNDYFITGKITDPGVPSSLTTWLPLVQDVNIFKYYEYETPAKDRAWISEVAIGGVQGDISHFLYCIGSASTAASVEGYAYEHLRHRVWDTTTLIAPYSAYAFVQVPPDLTKLNLIYEVQGLLDTSGGAITGVNNSLITRADHIVKLLYYVSNNFSLAGLDTTTFSPGSYAPNLAGITEGGEGWRDIVMDILENSACKLVPRRGTNSLALWAYGVRQSTSAVISENDCQLGGFSIAGEEGIINRVRVNYDRSATPLNTANINLDLKNYSQSYETSDAISIILYGIRDLSDSFVELKYVKTAAAVQRWASYKLAMYSKERMRVSVTVPFWKNDYRKLDLMDIIEISHVDNPSFFGSASAETEPPMTTDGADFGSDFACGDVWRRAKSYPMRILGRTPQYNVDSGEASITFDLLVLDNPDEIF